MTSNPYNEETRGGWFISTPYIDAYDIEDSLCTFPEFKAALISQTYEWGEMGLGRALLLGKTVPSNQGRLVLAFGTYDGKQYVADVAPGYGDAVRVVLVPSIPDDWDVT